MAQAITKIIGRAHNDKYYKFFKLSLVCRTSTADTLLLLLGASSSGCRALPRCLIASPHLFCVVTPSISKTKSSSKSRSKTASKTKMPTRTRTKSKARKP